jgi:hypothetical protein
VRGGDGRAEAGADGSDGGFFLSGVGALECGVLLAQDPLVVRFALGVIVVPDLP